MAVEVELFHDLDAVERDAAGALEREARGSLFERLSWFRLVADHCLRPGTPWILRAKDGERRAWLFLSVEGRCAEALACWYSLRFDAITEIGPGEDAAPLLAGLARALRTRGIALISLYPLAESGPLRAAFRKAGWLALEQPASVSWRIATYGMTFAAYWAGRSSRLRNTAQRKAKVAGLDIAIHSTFDEDSWADYERVYEASWKPEEGSTAFLRALAEQEGAAGTLRLGIARKDGEPLAAQLWLVEDGVATIHKLAYVEEAKKLSPGTVLSMEMFRHVLDIDHVRAIDFGLGDDAYKADWMDQSAPIGRLVAFNPRTALGLYRFGRALASTLVGRARSR